MLIVYLLNASCYSNSQSERAKMASQCCVKACISLNHYFKKNNSLVFFGTEYRSQIFCHVVTTKALQLARIFTQLPNNNKPSYPLATSFHHSSVCSTVWSMVQSFWEPCLPTRNRRWSWNALLSVVFISSSGISAKGRAVVPGAAKWVMYEVEINWIFFYHWWHCEFKYGLLT